MDIVELPFDYDGPIKVGAKILIDLTVLTWQSYVKGGESENKHLVDRNKGLYHIHPSFVILYQNEGEEWKAHNNNLLMKQVDVKHKEKSSLIITPKSSIKKKSSKKAMLEFVNEDAKKLGVDKGDVIYFKDDLVVDVYFENKHYWWTKNNWLIAVELKNAS